MHCLLLPFDSKCFNSCPNDFNSSIFFIKFFFLVSISFDLIFFGLFLKEQNKSIGKAANPIPPKNANNNQETNNKTAIAYIKKLTFISISPSNVSYCFGFSNGES